MYASSYPLNDVKTINSIDLYLNAFFDQLQTIQT